MLTVSLQCLRAKLPVETLWSSRSGFRLVVREKGNKMIKVLVVDDEHLFRHGIVRLLKDAPGVKVVGDIDNAETALRLISSLQPHVVLMDVNLPGIGGLEATRKIRYRHANVKVILLLPPVEQLFPSYLPRYGANGFLTRNCHQADLFAAIRAVQNGDPYVEDAVSRGITLSLLTQGKERLADKLSSREMQIMLMLARGRSSRDISENLRLSPKTINTYRCRIYKKLGVSSLVDLVLIAMNHGLIEQISYQPLSTQQSQLAGELR